jgi:hypothetical protein
MIRKIKTNNQRKVGSSNSASVDPLAFLYSAIYNWCIFMLCIGAFSEVLGMFLNLVQTYVPVISALGILRPKLVVTSILEVFGLMLCDCVILVLNFMMTKLIDIYVRPGSGGNVMFDLGDVLLCGHYHFDMFRSYSAVSPDAHYDG